MLTRLFNRVVFNVTAIKSVPGHLPPRKEDNPAGRYAGSLFSSASEKEQLDVVQEDLNYVGKLLKQSPQFKGFINNISIQKHKQKQLVDSTLSSNLSPITKQFLHILIDTGRLTELPKIAEKFDEYVKILSKQEDIRIISAKTLNQAERKEVVDALTRGRPGVEFNVEYEVDSTILGGLQAYSGSTFLDCSLRSRIEKLKTELDKL